MRLAAQGDRGLEEIRPERPDLGKEGDPWGDFFLRLSKRPLGFPNKRAFAGKA